MQLGLSSYTYGWAVGVRGHPPAQPLDELGLLAKARQRRVGLVQIGDNLPLHTFPSERIDRLATESTRLGLRLEIGARGLTTGRLAEYAALARRLSARLIRFVIDDADYQPQPETVIRILREAEPELAGLTLGLENHDRFPVAVLRKVVDAVDSERVGICLDTANSLGAGEGIGHVVATLAPVTVNLHIKDFAVARLPHQMGFTVTGRPAGQGLLDIRGLLSQLIPYPRCATAILELWTPPEESLAATIAKEDRWAAESLEHLRDFF